MNHNLAFNTTTTCPFTGETNTLCVSPQLVSTTFPAFGYGNVAPSSNSANVVAAGVTISGITTDFNGVTRPSPPAIGAEEFQSTASSASTMSGGAKLSGGAVLH